MEAIEGEVRPQGERDGGYAARIFSQIQRVIDETGGRPGALIRVLREAQGLIGHLPLPVLKTISRDLRIPLSDVYSVTSYYRFLDLAPKGEHVVRVCVGTCCYVRGGERILSALRREFGVKPGETTEDGKLSLEAVRCLSYCGMSPVVAVDDSIYRHATPSMVKEVLSACL